MGEVIAVLSGKGGTGKTSLCAGIATALAQLGEKVLCIDCDIGLRNLDISLGMSDSGALSFVELCQGGYQLSQAATQPQYPTLSFLTAPVHLPWEGVDRAAFFQLLQQAKQAFAYILLDAPSGLAAGFQLCAEAAERVILVTTPDPGAIRCAAHAGQELEKMGKQQVRMVVNRVDKKFLELTRRTIDDIMDETGLPLLGLVPQDDLVTLAAVAGAPLLEHSRKGAAAAYIRIAKRIQGLPVTIQLR